MGEAIFAEADTCIEVNFSNCYFEYSTTFDVCC
jgi:hypothetical protein